LSNDHRSTAGRARTRGLVALAAACLVALSLAPAVAASSTLSSPTSLSGSSTVAAVPFHETGGGVTITGSKTITVSWTQPATLGTVFDPNLVRQGRALNPSDSYTPLPGVMSVAYALTDLEISWEDIGPIHLGSPTYTTHGTCSLQAGGPDYSCDLDSPQVPVLDTFPAPGPFVKLSLGSHVTVSPHGIATLRTASFGGVAGGTAGLSLHALPIVDNLSIPCTAGAGDDLSYALGGLSTTPDINVETDLNFDVGVSIPNPIFPIGPLLFYPSFATPTIDLGSQPGSIDMTGAGATFNLGPVQKNNAPPNVVATGDPYSGDEGSPVAFDGSHSSSICGFPTLRWDFSDGGVAFGKVPHHTFQAPGNFSGQLTATDTTGLASTTTFSVDITNVAPAATAGPGTTAAWGRSVAFNGSATDPGADDQSTLTYSWSFGDGSPSATGGPSTSHAYVAPGAYTATLTACDRWGACDWSTRIVTVTKRTVTVGYLGDTAGRYDTAGGLSASLVDQFGANVSGRTIDFTVDGAAAGSAVTNSSGIATASYTPSVNAGDYATTASFAGDSLYVENDGAGAIAIARKATTVTYTGALSGGPNKTVILSAVLRDATGTALANRSIDFQLGNQTATATTDSSGVASTTLKLNQKNAKYSVTATWVSSGADAARYTGSVASATFSLQAK
jgi:PKD domain